MDTGTLYFVKDSFYDRFVGCGLLENKAIVNGVLHMRPCCYLFKYDNNPKYKIYWMIPVSSQVSKYKQEYLHSMSKYGMCDNISFGYVLGRYSAFLPQNLFPVTLNYINNQYLDSNTNLPIVIPRKLQVELNRKARKKIRFNFSGRKLGLTDITTIYNALLSDLQEQEN